MQCFAGLACPTEKPGSPRLYLDSNVLIFENKKLKQQQ